MAKYEHKNKPSKPKAKRWKALSREVVFEKYGRKIEKVIFRLPSGKHSDFYLKAEKDAVCILALTKEKDVILVKQYRPGPDKVLMELPGGAAESNETPTKAAERELLEETGYRGKMRLVTRVFDCAYSTIDRYCFVATDCEKVRRQELDKAEFAEVTRISLKEFRKLLKSGKMTDVEVGYLGLDYLGLL
jgi:ADP-ribose pyrophosphatase